MNDSRWSANVVLRSGLGAREQGGRGGELAAESAMQQHAGTSGGRSGGGMNSGESGILRKPGIGGGHHYHHHLFHQDNFADLLVFGYSCKVFRDDEKARFIDQGRHLIPWMGDNQLKIDRYDARGALHDLSQHEPPLGGYGNRFDCLPPAEQRAEQLCEEERYYSLYANEVEEEIQQEEKAKREAVAGAEIPFDYDAPPAPVVGPEPAAAGDDDENSLDPPFVAPANFEIPSDLDLPETMKAHAIIEKTAKFIASQDSQMEILLRAKQADNPQFGFLSPGGRLFRYYRHMLMAIKTNQYPEDVPEEEANGEEDAIEDASAAAEPSPEKPAVIIPAIKYKPSIDCAYTQLISKITGAPIPKDKPSDDDLNIESASLNLPTQPNEGELAPEATKPNVSKVSTGLAGLVQYDSDSDDESVDERVVDKKDKKPEPEMEKREITFSGKLPPEIFQHVIEKTATYVAKNGYSFEEALRTKNDPRFLFLRKDHEFYPFYAFRVRYLINPFEEVPKSPEKVTITREIENGTVVETPSIGIKTVNTAPVPVPAPQTQIQANKPGGAVCFSIKSKDDASVALKSNVAQELGGDEEEVEPAAVEQKKEREKSKSPVPREKTPEVVEQLKQPSEEKVTVEEDVKVVGSGITSTTPPIAINVPVEELKSSTPPLEDGKPVTTSSTPPDSSAGENASKDQKRLEDRIKDKLAVAAREKLASLGKEKQLQLERKKKASMFVSLISKTDSEPATDEPPAKKQARETTPGKPTPVAAPESMKNGLELLKNQFSDHEDEDDKNGDEQEADGDGSSDSSELSVHSIPSGSESPDSKRAPSSAEDDVVFVAENNGGRLSRSRTRSKSVSISSASKHKKRKHKHKSKSKKSKKKKSGGTSRSRSRTPSKKKRKRSRSRSKSSRRSRSRTSLDKDSLKKKKKKSKKKSHKHSKTPRSSSSSRHHHRKEPKEKNDRYSDY